MKTIINSTNSVPEPGKRTKRKGYNKYELNWDEIAILNANE
jgi:hypothetical protein